MRIHLLRAVKWFFFKTPLWRYFLPVTKFDMSVSQLNFILECIGSISNAGSVLEIGVGGGASSVRINQFLQSQPLARQFYAIDTFYGFTKEDIEFEQKQRNKKDDYLYYRSNSKEWYEKTLKSNGINDAVVFQADAKNFDYSKVSPIAFCLFDVDLFQPTEFVLPILYSLLVPGGIIVVDDCSADESIYDGAAQAYQNFCREIGVNPEVVFEKLGVIRKPLDLIGVRSLCT
jgi:predicted O-methyltransferase YrrM